jgi:hypothetical protein
LLPVPTGAARCFAAPIVHAQQNHPDHPRDRTAPWDMKLIFQAADPMEDLAMADVYGDGVMEMISGGRLSKEDAGLNMIARELLCLRS